MVSALMFISFLGISVSWFNVFVIAVLVIFLSFGAAALADAESETEEIPFEEVGAAAGSGSAPSDSDSRLYDLPLTRMAESATRDSQRSQSISFKKLASNGNLLDMGSLGTFRVTLSGEGVDDADDFNPQTHIESVNVRWERGRHFENLKADTTFNLVATRKEQAEQKKAMKAALNEEMANGAAGSGEGTGGGGSNDNPGGGDVTE